MSAQQGRRHFTRGFWLRQAKTEKAWGAEIHQLLVVVVNVVVLHWLLRHSAARLVLAQESSESYLTGALSKF